MHRVIGNQNRVKLVFGIEKEHSLKQFRHRSSFPPLNVRNRIIRNHNILGAVPAYQNFRICAISGTLIIGPILAYMVCISKLFQPHCGIWFFPLMIYPPFLDPDELGFNPSPLGLRGFLTCLGWGAPVLALRARTLIEDHSAGNTCT